MLAPSLLPASRHTAHVPRPVVTSLDTHHNPTCCQTDPEPPISYGIPILAILSSRLLHCRDKPMCCEHPVPHYGRRWVKLEAEPAALPRQWLPFGGWMRPQRLDAVPAITSRIPAPAPASVVLTQRMPAGKGSRRLAVLDSSGFTTVHGSLRKAPSSKCVWQLCACCRCATKHQRPQAAFRGGAGDTAIQPS